ADELRRRRRAPRTRGGRARVPARRGIDHEVASRAPRCDGFPSRPHEPAPEAGPGLRSPRLPMPALLRHVVDDAAAGLARLCLRVFFRDVEVVGTERLPRGVPLLFIANHVNNLIDPMVIMAFVGGRPRFLAKSTLWRHPVVAPLLVFSGAVPVYRHSDGARVARNFETFARCREILARGATVAVFPEGQSHNQPGPAPLKTGAARIALETEARHGRLGLRIVPVGLVYEDKQRFRSRVLVQVGDP